ncbi:MAG: site-specific integrase [Anaerolineaceae bacterium]|nr:site-specific integrase [Anaerolineaceae bacterium]
MNEGSEYTLHEKGGRWYAVVSYKEGERRKQKWLKTGGDAGPGTKKTARTAARAAVSEWRAAVVRTAEAKTELSAVLETFIQSLRKQRLQGSTIAGYANELRRFSELLPAGIHIQDITTEMLQQGLETIRARGVTENTIRHYTISLKRLFAFAMTKSLISFDPSQALETPTAGKYTGAGYYSADEARALLDAAKGTVSETPVYLALFLGLRRSEIAGLRWDDIDMEGGKVTVRRKTVQYMDKGELVVTSSDKLKTDSSNRVLPIPAQLLEVLSSMDEKTGVVCKGRYGKPMSPDIISQAFRRLLIRKGLRHIRFHDLSYPKQNKIQTFVA